MSAYVPRASSGIITQLLQKMASFSPNNHPFKTIPNYFTLEKGTICKDIDECSSGSTCGPHGDCMNLEGDYECHCHPGFQNGQDSKSCQDVDECQELELACHDEGSTCLNHVGSFECMCPSGYHSINKTHCEDTDECLSQNDCQHECLNYPGSYRCACKSGFTLGEDGVSCQDQDECLVENGGCSHTCRNTEGGHFCECPPGFRLQDDHRTCQLVEEQKKNPCHSHQPPVNLKVYIFEVTITIRNISDRWFSQMHCQKEKRLLSGGHTLSFEVSTRL